MTTILRIKTEPGVVMPVKATNGSAGLDLSAFEDTHIYDGLHTPDVKVRTGICISVPPGYVGLLIERSSLHALGLTLANNVGVIDSDYTGEILIAIKNLTDNTIQIKKGQRIAQLIIVPIPDITLLNVDDLNESIRGCGGFGSTGS